jgi:hypothetical protein
MKPCLPALFALLLLGCATSEKPSPTTVYQRQAYADLTPTSFGALNESAGDLHCEGSTTDGHTLDHMTNWLTHSNRRIPPAADQKIVDEQLAHHFFTLVGPTGYRSLIDGGAVVAIIDSDDNHVVFWRVVNEVPFAEVEAAAKSYCSRFDRGHSARFTGQAVACSEAWPIPVSVGGKALSVRFTHAITSFGCLK